MAHAATANSLASPSPVLTPLKPGSDEHKRAFCAILLEEFNPYKPAILAWPRLSQDAKQRLTSLPFWNIAVETEGFAAARMQAMADTVTDPLIKEALSLNAFEEGRHKLVLRNMLNVYGIPLKPEHAYSATHSPVSMFIQTGYGECLDSFFSFGLFKMAKDSGYFPPELVDVFEPVVYEETRHITFFVNWVAYTAARKSFFPRIAFRLRCFFHLILAGLGRMSLATAVESAGVDDNFLVTAAPTLVVGFSVRKLLEVALAENQRRMQHFDARLLRPKLMPFFARMALKFLPKD